MRNERAWPQLVGRAVQTDPTLLHYASAITEQKKCWELLAEKFDRFQTLRNNMQQGVQTDGTCNIQQCWELLANNVASVCTGLKKNNNPLHQQAVCLIFGLQRRKRGKAFFCSRLSSLIRLIWVIQNYHEGYQLHLAGKMFLNL